MQVAQSIYARNSPSFGKLLIFIALLSSQFLYSAAQAADAVGALKFVRGIVTIETDTGVSRNGVKGEGLMQNELVTTKASSLAVIELLDGSRLVLRPNSEFRVEQFNKSETTADNNPPQSALLSLLRGGLRLVTGLIGKTNPTGYRLKTPVATIGIRGTEFNSRICLDDCAAEESQVGDAASVDSIKQGLYVNVDDGQVFLNNDSGQAVDLAQGESGYVADANTLPIKLALVPAFLLLDKIPSPSLLDFNNIEIPDFELDASGLSSSEEALQKPAVSDSAAQEAATLDKATEVEIQGQVGGVDISGKYEIDVSYGDDLPRADHRWFFGTDPDIVFSVEQKGNKISGTFSGDFDGRFKGKIDGDEVEFDLVLEALGGEIKQGIGTWALQPDGTLKGKFELPDKRLGVVSGRWTLTRVTDEGGGVVGFGFLTLIALFGLIVRSCRAGRKVA